jgi:alpha-glucosidase
LDAVVGKYVLIARRKGNDWFIGGIINHEGRGLEIPLGFLGDHHYKTTIYSDAPDTREYPNHLERQIRDLTGTKTLILKMAPGGGWAAHLRRVP